MLESRRRVEGRNSKGRKEGKEKERKGKRRGREGKRRTHLWNSGHGWGCD